LYDAGPLNKEHPSLRLNAQKNTILGGFRVQRFLRLLWSVSDQTLGVPLVKKAKVEKHRLRWGRVE
jgi:hypothetical protein